MSKEPPYNGIPPIPKYLKYLGYFSIAVAISVLIAIILWIDPHVQLFNALKNFLYEKL